MCLKLRGLSASVRYEQQLGGCPVTDGCSHGRLSALGKQPLALSRTGNAGKCVNTGLQSAQPGRTHNTHTRAHIHIGTGNRPDGD